MSQEKNWYYTDGKRYVPKNMQTYPPQRHEPRRVGEYREPPRRRECEPPSRSPKSRLNRQGRVARAVFICSLSLLLVICSLLAAGYAYLDSRFLSKIDYVEQPQIVPPEEISTIVLEDDGDTGEGEELSEEEAQALESMVNGGLVSEENLYSEKGVTNVLLLGTDSRSLTSNAGRSDAMIILSINENTKQLVMTSVMRDTCVSIPGRDWLDKINAANAYGGAPLAVDTVETNFGVRIDKYILINFYAFIDVVDALGGMELDINEDERLVMNNYITEINNHLGVNVDSGKLYTTGNGLLLTGKQVLGYVRNRYSGNGDFQRTERQRIVLDKLIEKCKSADISTLLNVAEAVAPYISTDYSKDEILGLAYGAFEYIDYEVVQSRLPIDGTWQYSILGDMSIISIDFHQNRKELIKNIYGR